MVDFSKINFTGIKKTTNLNTNNQPEIKTKPMPYDSVSFGNRAKVAQQGSDAMLDFLRKCNELLQQGQKDFVTDAMSLLQAGKINEAIAKISNLTLPNGAIETIESGTKVLAKNWDGSPIEHVFYNVEGFKNLGLIKSVDDARRIDLFNQAFGVQPKTTVGMVGWTNVKPPEGIDLSKAELTKLYEEGIEEFYAPVDKYFIEALGINPSDRALVSSVSYSGVDKALMDLGQQKGINTLTASPLRTITALSHSSRWPSLRWQEILVRPLAQSMATESL